MSDAIEYYMDILVRQETENFTPDGVVRRCMVEYENKQNSYKIKFLNEIYSVNLNEKKIKSVYDSVEVLDFDLCLLILFYLVNAKQIEISGEYVTKCGDIFFTGSHELPTAKLAEIFGTKPDMFLERGFKLGGKKLNLGDISFELFPFPRIPIVYVLWLGDEELDTNVSILFDETIEIHCTLDIIYGLVKVVTKKLCNF